MSLSDPTPIELVCHYPGCKSSGRVFRRPYELTRHKLIHFPNKKLFCPAQGCKLRKRGKFHTRDDKFREHLDAHGELALWCCPLPGCNFEPVPKPMLDLHVGNDHDILEQKQATLMLNSLRIGHKYGHWSCIFRCGVEGNGRRDLEVHLQTHDLAERWKATAVFKSLGFSLMDGKATCPICKHEVNDWDAIWNLCLHLEKSHSIDDLVAHSGALVELFRPIINGYFVETSPNLHRVLLDSIATGMGSTLVTASDPASSPPSNTSGTSSGPVSSGNDVLWTASQESTAATDSLHFGSFEDVTVTAEQFLPENTGIPQKNIIPLLSFNTLSHQNLMLQQSSLSPQLFVQPQLFWSQQEIMQKQPYLSFPNTLQPQQSIAPDMLQASLATPGAVPMYQNIGRFEYPLNFSQDWSGTAYQPIFQPAQQFQRSPPSPQHDMTAYGWQDERLAMGSLTPCPQNMTFQQDMIFDKTAYQHQENLGPENYGQIV